MIYLFYLKVLADAVVEFFGPIHREYIKLRDDREYLRQILAFGQERALERAQETMTEARRLFGLNIHEERRKYLVDDRLTVDRLKASTPLLEQASS